MILNEMYDEIVNINGYDHQEGDLEAAADWLTKPVNRLRIEVLDEPTVLFRKQVEEMIESYKKFPNDLKRVKRIMEEVKATGILYPVYVQTNDRKYSIIEGNHRIVAFWYLGYKEVPVAFVS